MKLPKEKQTSLGLYVTSTEAYEIWKDSPKKVKVLDVRTLDEYINIGHAKMAWNIPGFLQTYNWDAEKNCFSFKMNDDFIKHVQEVCKPEDIILVTCRSGGRSAFVVNLLDKLGYKFAYNITDGFEGDTVTDPESLYQGQRLKNGWKNSGLPWTFKVDPKLMRVPTHR
ncbi:rhodanese-like domain-containing protein [Lutimonas halocynthiae]|uniref:rhodanese-like domain-containing protein n=1 Tax=Lutimonas halocynthiae TaxID=1446477 RepID=UPI0025B36DE2|nr:rhodanese-like domain-containing protein [Lutimonas halocynthiae]MDN3641918.1 rhodanese-like domain-containing protein [Lutimonas halocynthiae]